MTPNKRVLTPTEEYGIAVYYTAGIPIRDISERFDVSRSGVNRVVKRLGVTVDRGKRTEKEPNHAVREG